jgi:hypothetical protein
MLTAMVCVCACVLCFARRSKRGADERFRRGRAAAALRAWREYLQLSTAEGYHSRRRLFGEGALARGGTKTATARAARPAHVARALALRRPCPSPLPLSLPLASQFRLALQPLT